MDLSITDWLAPAVILSAGAYLSQLFGLIITDSKPFVEGKRANEAVSGVLFVAAVVIPTTFIGIIMAYGFHPRVWSWIIITLIFVISLLSLITIDEINARTSGLKGNLRRRLEKLVMIEGPGSTADEKSNKEWNEFTTWLIRCLERYGVFVYGHRYLLPSEIPYLVATYLATIVVFNSGLTFVSVVCIAMAFMLLMQLAVFKSLLQTGLMVADVEMTDGHIYKCARIVRLGDTYTRIIEQENILFLNNSGIKKISLSISAAIDRADAKKQV